VLALIISPTFLARADEVMDCSGPAMSGHGHISPFAAPRSTTAVEGKPDLSRRSGLQRG
jgi:hypothetical protein